MSQEQSTTVNTPLPLTVNARNAARLLSVSTTHFYAMHNTGTLGPAPARYGGAVRWVVQELKDWLAAGSPNREKWRAVCQTPVT
jgi:predicted DNA-binding transcriptional regulator AlpA